MIAETYTPTQQRLIELGERLQAFKPADIDMRQNFFEIPLPAEATELRKKAAATPLGRIMLAEGEPLGYQPPNAYYGALESRIGTTKIIGADMRVFRMVYDKYVRVEGVHELVGYDTEYELVLQLSHQQRQEFVIEELVINTKTSKAPATPSLQRNLFALDYNQSGYEGHGLAMLQIDEAEANQVISFFERCLKQVVAL